MSMLISASQDNIKSFSQGTVEIYTEPSVYQSSRYFKSSPTFDTVGFKIVANF